MSKDLDLRTRIQRKRGEDERAWLCPCCHGWTWGVREYGLCRVRVVDIVALWGEL